MRSMVHKCTDFLFQIHYINILYSNLMYLVFYSMHLRFLFTMIHESKVNVMDDENATCK